MNRCIFKFRALMAGATIAAAAIASPSAHAQDADASVLVTRDLPKAALLGRMLVQQPPDVLLNGQPTRLAPGARIRDENNQIALSGALMGQAFPVKYLLDSSGLVSQAWILTADEVRASRKGFSLSQFLFGSDTATGPVDDGKTPFDQLPRFPNQ
jgi:hypothetical protein